MKDGYTILNDKYVLVTDYDKNSTKREFVYNNQDNLENILKEENIFEYLKNKKGEMINQVRLNKELINRNKTIKELWLISITLFEVIFAFIFYLYGGLNFMTFAPFIFGMPMTAAILVCCNTGIKKFKRQNRGYELELEEIEKKLEITDKKIKKILEKSKKSNCELKDLKTEYVKINQKEELKKISEYLHNYYIKGYNEKKCKDKISKLVKKI